MRKRTLSLLLVMLMTFAMIPQSFAAENVLKLTAENVSQELKVGESVSVKINADQNPAMHSAESSLPGIRMRWN